MLYLFRRRVGRRGFTLLELLVVMAVLAVLVSMGVPKFKGYLEDARMTRLSNDARLLQDAAAIYNLKHDAWPVGEQLSASSFEGRKLLMADLKDVVEQEEDFWERFDSGEIKLYAIDMDVLRSRVRISTDPCHFVLRNPHGSVYIVDPPYALSGGPGGSIGPGEEPRPSGPLRDPEPGEFEVWTAEDLRKVGSGIDGWDMDKNYIQMADIDLSGYSAGEGWEPIGVSGDPFKGRYDGNGFNISGLKIDRPDADCQGLFGEVRDATIKNIGLVDVNILGNQYVGGVVGSAKRKTEITGCNSSGVVNGEGDYVGGIVGYLVTTVGVEAHVSDSWSTADITGQHRVGGIVGYAQGSASPSSDAYISRVWSSGNIKGTNWVGGVLGSFNMDGSINQSYFKGVVDGCGKSVGGLVGYLGARAKINDSYSVGKVYGNKQVGGLVGASSGDGVIRRSYAAGLVSGNEDVGGLLGGRTYKPSIRSCYWDKDVTCQTKSAFGSGVGKTTIEMLQRSTYGDKWNFDQVWAIEEGASYPYLRFNEQVPHPVPPLN